MADGRMMSIVFLGCVTGLVSAFALGGGLLWAVAIYALGGTLVTLGALVAGVVAVMVEAGPAPERTAPLRARREV